MRQLLAFAIAFLLFASHAVADAPTASPLIVAGKPIDPACLMGLGAGHAAPASPVDLRKCDHNDIVIEPGSPDAAFIGFSYRYKEDSSGAPYFGYRFLGTVKGQSILFIAQNTGGSGQFTDLLSVTIRDQMIVASEEIAGGDRCNGGIESAALSHGHILFDQDITPYDLIGLGVPAGTPGATAIKIGKPPVDIQAYKDLEASAASCVAIVHNRDRKWTAVTLSQSDWQDQPGWTDQFRFQACFNKLYRDYVNREHTELDRRGVAKFADAFAAMCLKPL